MQGAVERRAERGRRIPLDVLVELMHEDYEEPFEADAVNVGLGGLSMRAPYLPDVGARMTCRFACPSDGERIEADAEVVWAQDTGARTGEFGLRFVGLPEEAQRAIRRMVRPESYRPPPPSAEDTVVDLDEGPATVELALDGVGSPIVARVIHEDASGVAVEQELPFLRLRTGVTLPDGRRGRIEAVDLSIEGDTPKLLLDVSFDERSFVVPAADATVPDFIATGEPTEDLEHDTAEAAPPEMPEPESSATPEPPKPVVVGGREPSQVFVTTSREEHERELAEQRERELAAERAAPVEPVEEPAPKAMLSKVAPVVALLRAKLAVLFSRLAPTWAAFVVRARAAAARVAARSGPLARRVGGTIVSASSRAFHALRDRVGRRFPRLAGRDARRRTTSPAPRESNVARPKLRKQKAEDAAPVVVRGKGRTVLVAAFAAAAVALGVYAFLPSEPAPEAERIEVPRAITPPPAAESATPSAIAAEAGETEALPVQPTVTPSMPTALGDPSREAGPMPPPTFPSLREGARPAAPSSLPEGSPYAVDVRSGEPPAPGSAAEAGASTFGAASVPNARTFLIRMSRPVDRIEGTALTDGFRIRIPGSLSLDRAGPIASTHASVDRSMILNRGDHAELTIRFVAGRTPAYRVVARGSAIEVSIAE